MSARSGAPAARRRTVALVRLSSAASGSSSEQHLRVAREGSRQRDPLPLPPDSSAGRAEARCPMRETIEVGVGLVPARELDVLANAEVWEERVVLEEEANGALVQRSRRSCASRRTTSRRPRRPSRLRPHEPGDRAQDRRLARSRRADQRDGPLRPPASAGGRRPEAEPGSGRGENCHERSSRRERSRARLKSDEYRAHGDGRVEVAGAELGVDRERQRLRHALEAAGEHDRRSELADAAGDREREAGERGPRGQAGG